MAENVIERLNRTEQEIEHLRMLIVGDRELQSRGINNGAMQRIEELAATMHGISQEIREANAATNNRIDALRGQLEGQAAAESQRLHALIALVTVTFTMSLSALAALWFARL